MIEPGSDIASDIFKQAVEQSKKEITETPKPETQKTSKWPSGGGRKLGLTNVQTSSSDDKMDVTEDEIKEVKPILKEPEAKKKQ